MTTETMDATWAFEAGESRIPAEAGAHATAFQRPVTLSLRRPPDWLENVLEKLDQLAWLKRDWDSYDGQAPHAGSIQFARLLIQHLATFVGIIEPAVGASGDGEVGFSWDQGEWSLDVEALSTGQFAYVYLNETDPSRNIEAVTRNADELVVLLTAWE